MQNILKKSNHNNIIIGIFAFCIVMIIIFIFFQIRHLTRETYAINTCSCSWYGSDWKLSGIDKCVRTNTDSVICKKGTIGGQYVDECSALGYSSSECTVLTGTSQGANFTCSKQVQEVKDAKCDFSPSCYVRNGVYLWFYSEPPSGRGWVSVSRTRDQCEGGTTDEPNPEVLEIYGDCFCKDSECHYSFGVGSDLEEATKQKNEYENWYLKNGYTIANKESCSTYTVNCCFCKVNNSNECITITGTAGQAESENSAYSNCRFEGYKNIGYTWNNKGQCSNNPTGNSGSSGNAANSGSSSGSGSSSSSGGSGNTANSGSSSGSGSSSSSGGSGNTANSGGSGNTANSGGSGGSTGASTGTPTEKSAQPSNNPQTGAAVIIVAWVVGLLAIIYSLWYFKKSSSIN